ncbi:MAG TPA: TRAP transporter substrate-binding protein [Ureibacillus sp.]|nr:TRAP transporter substrate-binding protein [Ureibacillus sp.]
MKLKNYTFFALMVMLSLILVACVSKETDTTSSASAENSSSGKSDEKIEFKIAHISQPTHLWHETAEKFGEELAALSDGRMSVTIYPGGQLGTEADIVAQLETGSIDFSITTNAYMSTREPSLNGWFMPYLFNSVEDAIEMSKSDEAKAMLDTLSSQGLVGLDFLFVGNRVVLMKDGLVKSPADIKGKKMRIVGSPAMQEYWEEVGSGPIAMPLPEVYQSLQTGVIDGLDIDLDALVTEKYHEQANYLTLTNHMTNLSVIAMSQKSYDSLSPEDQAIVREALDKAVVWGNQEAITREKTNLQTLKDAGVEVLEEIDTSLYTDISQKMRDEYSAKSDIIKAFIEKAEQ